MDDALPAVLWTITPLASLLTSHQGPELWSAKVSGLFDEVLQAPLAASEVLQFLSIEALVSQTWQETCLREVCLSSPQAPAPCRVLPAAPGLGRNEAPRGVS